jgi:hypothetical protein
VALRVLFYGTDMPAEETRRRLTFRSYPLHAGVTMLLLLAWVVPSAGQEANESRYISSLNSALDDLIAKLSTLPQQPVTFGANLLMAHGVGVEGAPTKALLEYIDALKAAGAQKIEFNPGVTNVDNPEIMEKYDAVVKHIREVGLRVEINLVYARIGNRNADMQVRSFRDYAVPAVKACAQFAARYHPDYLVPVHEPLTMDVRMGIRVAPAAWVAYLDDAIRAVKRASPNTLVGAGAWYREMPYYQAFAAMPNLDFLTIDIYDQMQLNIYDRMVQIGHAANKPVSIEETWRPAFTGPLPQRALGTGTGIESHTIKGMGSADFEDLDAKWMKAMVLYASTHGIEAVTPFYSQTFFAYVTSGPDRPTDPEYNQKVIQAIAQGQRTKIFEEYRTLQQKFGRRSTGTSGSPHRNP